VLETEGSLSILQRAPDAEQSVLPDVQSPLLPSA
jgi:hypothetical protein